MLKVLQLSFYLDPNGRTPQQMLAEWESLVDVAEAAREGGASVCVAQASAQAAVIAQDGIDYHFIDPRSSASMATTSEFRELMGRVAPDLIHIHGLAFSKDVLAFSQAFPDVPILLQDHANPPPRFWRRRACRRAFAESSGIAFCAAAQAEPYKRQGLISASSRIFVVPESTSRFLPGDRDAARQATGIYGDPCLLWVGHLDANKDPLSVLEGVSRAARVLPNLRTWCCFGTAPLLREVKGRIESDPALRDRVHLLGRVPHAQVELLMRAADFFVLGSHREGSGYSLIEALACGLPPIVTDIPSFRQLTGARIGKLWACGKVEQFESALLALAGQSSTVLRSEAREHFVRELSFAAVGGKLNAAYRDLLVPKPAADRLTIAHS